MLRVKDKREVYKVAINAAMGSFLFGYQLVNISSLQLLFKAVNDLTPEQTQTMISLITASLPLTAILGAILFKKIIKVIKARHLMIMMDFLSIVGILIQDISLSFWCLLIGRLMLGFSVGINSGLVPQYIYSVTPVALAGSVGALHQVFLMVGVAFGYTLGYLIDPNNIGDAVGWRILLSFPILTCLIRSIVLAFILPYEIPSHRMKDKQIQRLQKYYYKIYQQYESSKGSLSPSRNSDSLPSSVQFQLQQPEQDKSSIFTNKNLMICLVLAATNQLCGINAILFYAKQLFMRITNNNNSLSQFLIIVLGVIQIIATLIGGSLMDKYSKRAFLLFGQLAMAVCLFSIFIFSKNQMLVIPLIFMHTIAYSLSLGQLLMYYAAKMLENTSNVIMLNWALTFVVAMTAQFMMKGLGIGITCLIFGCMIAICLSYLWMRIPDEKEVQSIKQELIKPPIYKTQLKQTIDSRQTSISEDQ